MSENRNTLAAALDDLSFSDFPYMPENTLEALRDRLDLQMSRGSLIACQTHYRLLRRTPTIDELYMLDALIAESNELACTYLPAEMKTDSPIIAEAFADMMAKRSEATLQKDSPASLEELCCLAENYIRAIDTASAPQDQVAVRFTAHRELSLAADGYLRTATTGTDDNDIAIGIRSAGSNFRGGKPAVGDYVYALVKQSENDTSFEDRLVEYLCSKEVKKAVKRVFPLYEATPLGALIRSSLGLVLSESATQREAGSAVSLVTKKSTGVIMIATPADSADLLLLAQENHFRICRIAKVSPGNSIRLSDGTLYPHGFFSIMVSGRPYSAEVLYPTDVDDKIALSRIGTCTLGDKKHAVIKVDATGENAYSATVKGLIYALSHSIAAGVALDDIMLSCYLSLPYFTPTPKKLGRSLAAILGLHRVQTEFELHGAYPVIKNSKDDMSRTSVAMVAPLPGASLPSLIVGGGSLIFYLEPLHDETGLPIFDDLKKMYRYIEKLSADGVILSLRPTSEDLLADLDAMSRNATVNYARENSVASHFGGFLVETRTRIQGTLVADTYPSEEKENEAKEPEKTPELVAEEA